MPQQPIKITLAPLRGITDALFREILPRHADGFNDALAPFINPQKHLKFPDRMLQDILPENNHGLPLTPQLLYTDPDLFLSIAKRIAGLGYYKLNWNLGCPAPQVTRKKRGSGFLPYPQEICAFLDTILPELDKIGCVLSIKMRLGYQNIQEGLTVISLLNNYPLEEIILHPRLGQQLYRDQTDVEGFRQFLASSRHKLVYNGDINTQRDFSLLKEKFPAITSWMIGRGAIANPFLAEEIAAAGTNTSKKRERLYHYHQELFTRYSSYLSGPGHLLGRMKLIWGYLINSFPGKKKALKKIQKSSTVSKYHIAVEALFTEKEEIISPRNTILFGQKIKRSEKMAPSPAICPS